MNTARILTTLVLMFGCLEHASASLITPTGQAQLESWLGEGPLSLTQIFSKTTGDGKTAANFHAAANGMGRTFSVMEVIANGQSYIIGGYNPFSWNSSSGYNITPFISQRTAFLFNLTSSVIQSQKLDGFGQYQTYNLATYGPTFGGGHDLYVDSSLNSGYALQFSYGVGGPGGYGGTNIVGSTNASSFNIGTIEVYTISNIVDVPVPSGLALCGTMFVTLGVYFGWQKRKHYATV